MPTRSARAVLDIRASAWRAVRMRRSASSISMGRISFDGRAPVIEAFVIPSGIHRLYRGSFEVIAITPKVLHTLGRQYDFLGAVMRVGIPTEIKNNEYRVAITPAGVAELVHRGHEVLIQAGAGEGSAISDADFKRAGAQLINSVDEVWAEADLLLKVKEPIEAEYSRLRKGQTLFTYLHLAASRPCTDALMASGTTPIAYETAQIVDGVRPILGPVVRGRAR